MCRPSVAARAISRPEGEILADPTLWLKVIDPSASNVGLSNDDFKAFPFFESSIIGVPAALKCRKESHDIGLAAATSSVGRPRVVSEEAGVFETAKPSAPAASVPAVWWFAKLRASAGMLTGRSLWCCYRTLMVVFVVAAGGAGDQRSRSGRGGAGWNQRGNKNDIALSTPSPSSEF